MKKLISMILLFASLNVFAAMDFAVERAKKDLVFQAYKKWNASNDPVYLGLFKVEDKYIGMFELTIRWGDELKDTECNSIVGLYDFLGNRVVGTSYTISTCSSPVDEFDPDDLDLDDLDLEDDLDEDSTDDWDDEDSEDDWDDEDSEDDWDN